MLMDKEGARQFYTLKADLEHAAEEAESGKFVEFDPQAYEPDAFIS